LSGGEQQRTALARTLVRRPRLLLLDEPLSALDLPTREPLRQELRRRLAKAAVPTVLVTHDRLEALSLADLVVVLDGGRVRQSGPVEAVFTRPADAVVARIVGFETVQPARVVEISEGRATAMIGAATLTGLANAALPAGCAVCVRAEDVALRRGEAPDGAINRLAGSVLEVLREGPLVRVHLDCGFPLTAVAMGRAWQALALQPGDRVTALVSAEAVQIVPPA
jgi:molybdate transport system ATP-binding protein